MIQVSVTVLQPFQSCHFFTNSIILFVTVGGASTATTTGSSSSTTASSSAVSSSPTTTATVKETFSLSSHDDQSKEMKDNRVLKMVVTKKTDTSEYFLQYHDNH